jgi:hypothetical protein
VERVVLTETDLDEEARKLLSYTLANWVLRHLDGHDVDFLEKQVVFQFPSGTLVLKDDEGAAPRFEVLQ